jgi:hypothetical protein
MAHCTAIVVENTLSFQTNDSLKEILVGSDDWFAWLRDGSTFAYATDGATFTAKKKARRGSWYWYAFATREKRTKSAYLGRSQDLTVERLRATARKLNQATPQPSGYATSAIYGSACLQAGEAHRSLKTRYTIHADHHTAVLNTDCIRAQLERLLEGLQQQRCLMLADSVQALDLIAFLLTVYERDYRDHETTLQALRDNLAAARRAIDWDAERSRPKGELY